ncbi:hypothetical protein DES36_11927 [Alkalibaculum bacchi]|uniref:Uncharacterized protein n=1 Tax=Alkalibaculum bacchi TaxID=645887 RepID=A0A366HYU7_9FIRM|nr:hypothetical protein [Alkalibaculum bacchi]RBP59302.1 hypothetical protein DES36_11927 [Alkalibaculum bacchi]
MMEAFLKFYNEINFKNGFALYIYHSSIVDWCITIGYKASHPKHGEEIIKIHNSDMELAFAKAQVEFKQWLLENKGGY